MSASRRPRRPRYVVPVLLALSCALVTACGPVVDGPDDERGGPASTVPLITDVTPLEDPRAWTGAVDIDLPDPRIDPVDDDLEPSLPAQVTDAQGTEVTVTDASRILALDIYGTLAVTVFELGLGDRVVGRDVSAGFPEIADRPLRSIGQRALSGSARPGRAPTRLAPVLARALASAYCCDISR